MLSGPVPGKAPGTLLVCVSGEIVDCVVYAYLPAMAGGVQNRQRPTKLSNSILNVSSRFVFCFLSLFFVFVFCLCFFVVVVLRQHAYLKAFYVGLFYPSDRRHWLWISLNNNTNTKSRMTSQSF